MLEGMRVVPIVLINFLLWINIARGFVTVCQLHPSLIFSSITGAPSSSAAYGLCSRVGSCAVTLSIMAFIITTLSIMTLSIIKLSITDL
jgi:hypothetical protein